MGEVLDIVKSCENELGWFPAGNPWKARAAAAGRLQKAMDREMVPPADVRLALAWCLRHRQPIDHPSTLLRYVQHAKRIAHIPDAPSDIAQQVQDAITWEQNNSDTETDEWIGRLVRCTGAVRADVLTEWASARGQHLPSAA
jgi:hypothetical protein